MRLKSLVDAVVLPVLGALVLALPLAAPAQAAYIVGTCALDDVTAGGQNAVACLNYTGNNNNYSVGAGPAGFENYIAADFGVTGPWSYLGDAPTNGGQSGNWSMSPALDSLFVVTVKAAGFFAAYLFDGLNNVGSGTWDVAGATTKLVGDGSPASMSHLSFYVGPQSQVFEPAALGLFGLGLLGLGLAARRRQKS
jgi:hypothetical protein